MTTCIITTCPTCTASSLAIFWPRMETRQHDYDPTLGFLIKGKASINTSINTSTSTTAITTSHTNPSPSPPPPPPRPPPPQDICVICLDAITERAIAVPCNHLNFDFLCLCSWTQEHASCPLCKTTLTAIEYDWRSPTDCKVYIIPGTSVNTTTTTTTTNTTAPINRLRPSRPRRHRPAPTPSPSPSADAALAFRRQIYTLQTPCLHVGSNRTSQYQHYTPHTFSTSLHLQSRARLFMRRDLLCFAPFATNNAHLNFLIEYVIAILKVTEVKDASGRAQELVGEFLGGSRQMAALFLHELHAWLTSPFERLEDWDRRVQYTYNTNNK